MRYQPYQARLNIREGPTSRFLPSGTLTWRSLEINLFPNPETNASKWRIFHCRVSLEKDTTLNLNNSLPSDPNAIAVANAAVKSDHFAVSRPPDLR